MPGDRPITTPVPVPIVAIKVLLLLHAPPPVASLRVVVPPTHILAVPAIAGGPEVTVTVSVEIQLPPREYEIVAVPTATPVTTPVVYPTVAFDVLLLVHVPPVTASLRLVVAPTQMLVTPLTGPGAGLTVTVVVV